MPRAGKGTIQRQATVDLYAPELDALYTATHDVSAQTKGNFSDAADAVRKIIGAASEIDITEVSSHGLVVNKTFVSVHLPNVQRLSPFPFPA